MTSPRRLKCGQPGPIDSANKGWNLSRISPEVPQDTANSRNQCLKPSKIWHVLLQKRQTSKIRYANRKQRLNFMLHRLPLCFWYLTACFTVSSVHGNHQITVRNNNNLSMTPCQITPIGPVHTFSVSVITKKLTCTDPYDSLCTSHSSQYKVNRMQRGCISLTILPQNDAQDSAGRS